MPDVQPEHTRGTASDPLSSLVTTMTHEARIIRHAGLAYSDARGRDGLTVVQDALEAYYDWRAGAARRRGGPELPSIVASWGTAELLALNPQGWGELAVSDAGLRLAVTSSPELRHYRSHDVPAFAELHYGALARALAKIAGLDVAVPVEQDERGVWITVGRPDAGTHVSRPGSGTSDEELRALLRATSENRGALMVFLGRAADAAFGADGEAMYREAIRGFGAERGAAMRLDHLSRGLTRDLVSMLERYDSGGNTDVWEYRDDGVLVSHEWSQDCVYCPFVASWHELDGLRYAEIYDHEFHVAQFRAYRQDIEVRWGELQSRGDATCEFRFRIPGGTEVASTA